MKHVAPAFALLFALAFGVSAAGAALPEQPVQDTGDGRWERAVARVSARLGPEFTVAAEPPFLVASDVDPVTFEQHRTQTVRWAHKRLHESFFGRSQLARPIVIYLFRDKQSYESHTMSLFGETPSTPFGYYSARHAALIMNISTGGGTLVHEMVHPMLEADFPGVPSWFNEGLASLFEQCGESEGRIRGYLNWRLPGLKQAISAGRAVPLAALLTTNTRQFYGPRSGLHYAEARYLLYWLQEQGLLRTYYQRFRDGAATDPTGIEALLSLFPGRTLDELDAEWQAYVSKLEWR